ncbi:MAG: hypothetical protein AAFR17_05160, partial [Pseudomonadota bacterium]
MPASTTRIVWPWAFRCEAGLIDWMEIWRLWTTYEYDLSATEIPDWVLGPPGQAAFRAILNEKGIVERGAHLRWATLPQMGIPSRAFKVWRRQNYELPGEQAFPLGDLTETPDSPGVKAVSWGHSVGMARLVIDQPAPGGLAIGYSGNTDPKRWLTARAIAAGNTMVQIAGPGLTGVLLPQAANILSLGLTSAEDIANADDWELLEHVGLPVDTGEWAGIQDHDADQGVIAEGLMPPIEAAMARYQRGQAAVGWPTRFDPTTLAPPFELPDGHGLIEEMREQILGRIRNLMDIRPSDMHLHEDIFDMPPPENAAGDHAPTQPSQARFSPLNLMLSAVTSDPNLSLILGYGTALSQPDIPAPTQSAGAPFEGPDDFHYMITGEWDGGLTGEQPPLELAALALQPHFAFAGATPEGMEATQSQPMSPLTPDGDWRKSVRFSWDRTPSSGLYRVASFAAARAAKQPAGGSELINEPRDSGGFRPIAANNSPEDPDQAKISHTDRVVAIPAPALATQNGFITMRYAAVTQTIFGLWGRWNFADEILFEPSPNRVPILSASLVPQAVALGPCPATLTFDFAWDWSVRRPDEIFVGGRLWAAAKRSDPPPSDGPSLQLPRSLGGAQPGLTISFADDTPAA